MSDDTPVNDGVREQSNYNKQLAAQNISGSKNVIIAAHADSIGTSLVGVWDDSAAFNLPSTATAMTASSSSANDTLAGSGAQTVKVSRLDGNYDEQSETVALNGQTGVTLANSYLRVHEVEVLSVGGTGWNEGDVYIGSGALTAGVPATVYSRIFYDTAINTGENKSLSSLYTIPNGYKGYACCYSFTVNTSKQTEVWLKFRKQAEGFWKTVIRSMVSNGSVYLLPNGKYEVDEKTDIGVFARVVSSTTDIAAGYEVILEKQ